MSNKTAEQQIRKKVNGFEAIIEPDTDGFYSGQLVKVPAVLTQGRTIEEVEKNLSIAFSEYIEMMEEVLKDFSLQRSKQPLQVA